MKVYKEILKKFIRGKKSPTLPYKNREESSKFVAQIFSRFLKNSILNVGCGDNYLKDILPENIQCIGVDIEGNPDHYINLEKEKLELFDSNSFYTVVCTEVLEHLDNLHEVFDDICRVAKKYIIISLPNSWALTKFHLVRGYGDLKFYGLPTNKPKDRHKWFFNFHEAEKFLIERSQKNGFKIAFKFGVPLNCFSIKNSIKFFLLKLYYKNIDYENLFYSNLWALLEKL